MNHHRADKSATQRWEEEIHLEFYLEDKTNLLKILKWLASTYFIKTKEYFFYKVLSARKKLSSPRLYKSIALWKLL